MYATGRQEEEDDKTFVCDKPDRASTCVFCRDLHLTFYVLWSFTKRSVQRKVKFDEKLFQNNIIVTLVSQGLPSSYLSRPVA